MLIPDIAVGQRVYVAALPGYGRVLGIFKCGRLSNKIVGVRLAMERGDEQVWLGSQVAPADAARPKLRVVS